MTRVDIDFASAVLESLERMAAQAAAIRAVLIMKGLITHEEFESLVARVGAEMDQIRQQDREEFVSATREGKPE